MSRFFGECIGALMSLAGLQYRLQQPGGAGEAHREGAHRPEEGGGVHVFLDGVRSATQTVQRSIQAANPHEGPLRRETKQVHV